jgi:hypothetical protein
MNLQHLSQSHSLHLLVYSTHISLMIQLMMDPVMSMTSAIFTGTDCVAKSDLIYNS